MQGCLGTHRCSRREATGVGATLVLPQIVSGPLLLQTHDFLEQLEIGCPAGYFLVKAAILLDGELVLEVFLILSTALSLVFSTLHLFVKLQAIVVCLKDGLGVLLELTEQLLVVF